MSAPTSSPSVRDAAVRLASHLREHPEAALQSSDELAAQFDLPQEFVREVLEAVGARPPIDHGRRPRQIVDRCLRAGNALVRGFCCVTRRPILFIGVTGGLAALLVVLLSVTSVSPDAGGQQRAQFAMQGVSALPILATLVLHLLCYYRHAMTRVALMGALTMWLVATPTAMISMHGALLREEPDNVIALQLSVALAFLMVFALYGGLGIASSLVGGYVRLRNEDRAQQNLSRQELLQRLFEIQEKLQQGRSVEPLGAVKAWEWVSARFSEHPWLWTVVLPLVLNTISVLTIGPVADAIERDERVWLFPLMIALQATMTTLSIASIFTVAYLSRRYPLALARVLLYTAVSFFPLLIPLGPFGVENAHQWASTASIAWNTTLSFLMAGAGVIGAMIEERARWKLRLNREEPAALAAEMVRIQWKLAPKASCICVMVVDAAKSSEMKALSDPLEVEYSFREYQALIGKVTHECGGEVHSTAGDGAVAAFATCAEALHAAKRLQTEIQDFNQRVNRLDMPFRLRIGLHNGVVAGDLDKVEFTEVIDIAAHVQGHAPVGGIAITGSVCIDLECEEVTELREPVDGHKVLLILNPNL